MSSSYQGGDSYQVATERTKKALELEQLRNSEDSSCRADTQTSAAQMVQIPCGGGYGGAGVIL